MNRIVVLLLAGLVGFVPSAVRSASSVGVGPHGYDFLIGSWTCRNSMPSPMGGPALTTLTVNRAPGGSLWFHVTGTGFDGLGYVVYAPKTKTWFNPVSMGNGNYSSESTHETGAKTTWSGPLVDVSMQKTIPIRDTYTIAGATSYKDLTQAQIGGVWKTEADSTCTKS
jgi:hypothetical protein